MKTTAIVFGTLILVVLVVVAIGYMLPQNHRASRERMYSAPPEALFIEITNPAKYPDWRTGVKRVDILPPVNGALNFRESGSDGDIAFLMEIPEPGRRVVSRIADTNLAFGGKWTYELMPVSGGTVLRITEDGEVYNPLFRFMSRFIFGHYKSIDQYLDDLERRVGKRQPGVIGRNQPVHLLDSAFTAVTVSTGDEEAFAPAGAPRSVARDNVPA